MSNTIQFNNKEYHRIAAKRDVEAISQIRYGFFYLQWDVLIDGAYYLFANSKPINGVYNLVGTNITIPESAITKTVYEGMEVSVNIPNNTLPSIGTLHINSHYFNYGCSKSTVELSSACSLKLPSANYTARRLVREEDIIKPDTVKLYFDENYINVECFIKFGVPNYSIVIGTYDEYITRSINDDLSVDVLRSKNSQSYITCHVGDTIKIISTETPLQNVAIRPYAELNGDYPIIAPVDENGKVNTINLQKDRSFDYVITSDCFITFDIATSNYMLYGAIMEDTEYCDSCVVQVDNSDFIIAGSTELAKRSIQEHSKVNINTSLSIYTVEAYTKKRDAVFAGEPEYVLVDINNNPIYDTNNNEVYVDTDEYDGLSLLANSQGLIILSDNTSLPLDVQGWYNLIEVINLTTNTKETVTITSGGSHSSTSSAYFTMPSADCLLTVSIKIVTGGDTVTISPLYSLTIEVDENSNSVFPISVTTGNTTTEYNSSTTIQNIENNYFSTTWNEVDGKLYHILYKSNHTTFDDYTTKTASYSNSLMGNRTLSISLIDPDILYRNTTEISTITAGKEYEENNNIISNSNTIMGLNDLPRRTYYANTESSIKTSGNHFTNLQSLKKVVFNNANIIFTVNKDAFYECNKLESVSINGTENIKVKDRAFYNAIMLTEFNDLNKITELGKSCFYGVGLKEYTANTKLSVIPELAFSESLLTSVNLAGTSINPAMLSTIKESAFKNCLKLTIVHLPLALSELEQGVFENTAIPCVHTIPAYTEETVFSLYGVVFNVLDDYTNLLSILPTYTFKYCTNLAEVHLPASITDIKTGAFHECDNLKHFSSPGLKKIELGAFSNTWIEKKHTYNSDEMVGHSTYGDGSGEIYKYKDTEGIYFDYCRGELAHPNDHVVCIKPNPDKNNYILYKRPCPFSGSTNVYFQAPIFSIADYGFAYKDMINWLNPYSVDFNAYAPLGHLEYIGKYAFKDSGVKFVQFTGNSLHTLGEGAFYNCRALRNVFGLEESLVTKIEPYTFYNCGGDYYGIGWYDGSASIPSLDFCIPQKTTSIGDYAFANCKQLMGIKNIARCPITHIGEYAFLNCFRNTHRIWDAVGATVLFAVKTALEILALYGFSAPLIKEAGSSAMVSVAKSLFNKPNYNTPAKLLAAFSTIGTALTIADGTAQIVTAATPDKSDSYPSSLEHAIDKCISAEKTRIRFWLPKVLSIGEGAFKNCTYLGEVKFCNAMEEIPDYAFYNCKRLYSVSFASPDFSWDNVTSSTVEAEPHLVKIGKESFYNCNNLWDIAINNMLCGIVSICERAFKSSKINYSNFRDDNNIDINMGIVIDSTTIELQNESLGFLGDHTFTFISQNPKSSNYNYSASTFTSNNITLIVPAGSKDAYMSVFNMTSDKITELELNDQYWQELKELGYTVPWLNS